jgi:hypothetical protein
MTRFHLIAFGISILILGTVPHLSIHAQSLRTYNYSSHVIQLLDGDYYNRLDSINQQLVDWELSRLDRAYEYLDSSDWESALYWANQLNVDKYPSLSCDQYFVQTVSYIRLNNPQAYDWRYLHLKKECEPKLYRQADQLFRSLSIPIPAERSNEIMTGIRNTLGLNTGYNESIQPSDRVKPKINIGLGLGLGYQESGIYNADAYISFGMFVLSVGIGADFEENRLLGKEVNDVGWEDRIWDISETGTLSSMISLGAGLIFKDRILFLIKSINRGDQEYQNCIDPSGVIGYQGNYHKLSAPTYPTTVGVEINYLAGDFMFGLKYDKLNGLGGQLGFIHRFKNQNN